MPDRTDEPLIRQRFKDFLRHSGLSCTGQREVVLNEVLAAKGHFDAEDLVAQMRRKKKPASRATVYRTIRRLEEAGLLRRVDLDPAHGHYEFVNRKEHHEHLLCTVCGAVVEFSDPEVDERLATVARQSGFEVTGHRVQALGVCQACRGRGSESHA